MAILRPYRFVPGLACLFFAACAPVQKKPAPLPPPMENAGFSADLAAEYAAFAQSEAELGRQESSDYFAEKARMAGLRQPVLPKGIEGGAVNGDQIYELRSARQKLMDVRTDFMQRVASQGVARTQLLFDCWAMQAEENTENDPALPCRTAFQEELYDLDKIGKMRGVVPTSSLPAYFTILFPAHKDSLAKGAEHTIDEILRVTDQFPEHEITVTGYSDPDVFAHLQVDKYDDTIPHYSHVLAMQRAANVAQALADAGIDPQYITIKTGDEDTAPIPPDGKSLHDRNRRVVIAVTPQKIAPPKKVMAWE